MIEQAPKGTRLVVPPVSVAAATPIWLLGSLYFLAQVVVALLVVCLGASMGLGYLVLLTLPVALAVGVGLLFRRPRLLLGWCGGSLVVGLAAFGAAAAVFVPQMTGHLGDIGLGALCFMSGGIGVVAGPFIGLLMGRWWERRAASRNRYTHRAAHRSRPLSAKWHVVAWIAAGAYVAGLAALALLIAPGASGPRSAQLAAPVALAFATLVLVWWPRLALGWAIGGIVGGVAGLFVLWAIPAVADALPRYDLGLIVRQMGASWVGFLVCSPVGLILGGLRQLLEG